MSFEIVELSGNLRKFDATCRAFAEESGITDCANPVRVAEAIRGVLQSKLPGYSEQDNNPIEALVRVDSEGRHSPKGSCAVRASIGYMVARHTLTTPRLVIQRKHMFQLLTSELDEPAAIIENWAHHSYGIGTVNISSVLPLESKRLYPCLIQRARNAKTKPLDMREIWATADESIVIDPRTIDPNAPAVSYKRYRILQEQVSLDIIGFLCGDGLPTEPVRRHEAIQALSIVNPREN